VKDLITKINGVNVSIDMNNYDEGIVDYTLVLDTSYIELELYKPFKNVFIEVTEQTLAGTVHFEYYNGTSWVDLDTTDYTKDLSKSGFLLWEQETSKIRLSGDITGKIAGINMVFANDSDLKIYYRAINDYLGQDSSFIALHQATRNDIIQKVRNTGNYKIEDNKLLDITIWDFLNPFELRTAATYLCLSKIFSGISDSVDGKFAKLADNYYSDYLKAEQVFIKTIDVDNNGVESDTENYLSYQPTTLVWS